MGNGTEQERVAISAPKWAMGAILIALLGGGGTIAAYKAAAPAQAEAAIVAPTRFDLAESEARSKAHADAAVVAAKAEAIENCRRDLAQAMGIVTGTLAKIDQRLDKFENGTVQRLDRIQDNNEALKVDVAAIKARRK